MNYTMNEVLQFVNENDVKFIRLAFCDIFGKQRNISITSGELPRAFETGISFDASAVPGFMNVEESDLFLYPDPGTLAILPWRPSQGRVVRFFCDIRHPDGRGFEGDGRSILKKAAQRAQEKNYVCKIGTECEFYLFQLDEQGEPTKRPYDRAGYMDIAPADRGENVRREICLTLEEMGITPESSHHEQGPGQNEIVFKYADALAAADNLITFQSVVKTVAARNGLYASFMPKPLPDSSGNGLHINLSLSKHGLNIFKNSVFEHSDEAESFIAGIQNRIREITAFCNPLTNSYARFGSFEAPRYITWSHQNRSQLIRIPAASGEYARMELRSPDPACNPYLVLALLLQAGLEGIENGLPLCPPTDCNLYTAPDEALRGLPALPTSLTHALSAALDSNFVKSVLPAGTLACFAAQKRREIELYAQAQDKAQIDERLYFTQI